MEDKQLYTVLSIDGGGIRGIVPLRVIAEIEARLGRPISDAIDLAAGSSTGGIIAAGLTAPHPIRQDQPRFKAKDLEQFYVDDGPDIFEKKRWFAGLRSLFAPKYNSAPLEASMRRFFGDTRLEDALTSIMLTAYDIERRESVFMRHLKNNTDGSTDRRWKVRDAALATSSAPTYFKPARVRSYAPEGAGSKDEPAIMEHALVDGAIFVQNPAAAAFIAAHKEKPEDAEMMVISLGTGNLTRVFQYEDAKRWGGLGWINPNNDVPAIAASMDGQSSAANQNMEFLLGDKFIRLDADLKDEDDPSQSPNDAFDDASPENIRKVKRLADRLIEHNSDKIDEIVEVLRTRMHQKDLERGPRPRPDAGLAAAVRDNEPDDLQSKMMGWLRGAGLWPAKEPDPTDLGWDGKELEQRRREDKEAEISHQTGKRDRSMLPAEDSELEALRAIAHRYAGMVGKKPKDIDAEIDEALEMARTAAQRNRAAAAESAEALAQLEGSRTDGLPDMTRVVHSDDLDAPPPANENRDGVDQGVIDALVDGGDADEEPPISWRQPPAPNGRDTAGPGGGPKV